MTNTADTKPEQVYVHPRDLACRYIVLKSGEAISYSVKPQRNSVFFAIYKQSTVKKSSTVAEIRRSSVTPSAVSMGFADRMHQAQLEEVTEKLKLIGGKVHRDTLQIEASGTYALVFDNTFSKQKSKLVSYTLQVHPSALSRPEEASGADTLIDDEDSGPQVQEEHLTGILLKRRRKKLQGWARRWFVLDFQSNTLNYYLNSSSTVLRGAISLRVAVFSANKESLEINIDSGEIWNLRAQSEGAFSMWCQALAASRDGKPDIKAPLTPRINSRQTQHKDGWRTTDQIRLWARLDTILADLNAVKESLRETIIELPNTFTEAGEDRSSQTSPSRPRVQDAFKSDSNLTVPRRNFWGKKRPSELAAMTQSTEELFKSTKASTETRNNMFKIEAQLDVALQSFAGILREQKLSLARPIDKLQSQDNEVSRASMDSLRSDEDVWTDAVSVFEDTGFLVAHHDPESAVEDVDDDASSEDGSYSSHLDLQATTSSTLASSQEQFPKDLYPLAKDISSNVIRRMQIPAILDQPPSTLKLMTSKVGSDVSSMSAPAATNEPLGLLQKSAEELEYSELLEAAIRAPAQDGQRILLIAAFAVSSLSSMRHKERAKRKPFTPMLGETFELVREDKGFRFIAEKVQHRPITGIASCAESASWTFHQYQATTQKFYGKSMLLTTEGLTTVHLETGDTYVWEKPELYLKGITWGERFIEPTGEMVIRNVVSGELAIIKFLPAKGWGAGRSEEVLIEAYSASNEKCKRQISGTWTQSLQMDKQVIWQVGTLVDDAANRCGFTTFAAQLNQMTLVEQEHLPPTDSRLRPDVRAREEGRLEDAERLKIQVEDLQRRRRAELEAAGQAHVPKFFKSSADGKRWQVCRGEENYWTRREGSFDGTDIVDLFNT